MYTKKEDKPGSFRMLFPLLLLLWVFVSPRALDVDEEDEGGWLTCSDSSDDEESSSGATNEASWMEFARSKVIDMHHRMTFVEWLIESKSRQTRDQGLEIFRELAREPGVLENYSQGILQDLLYDASSWRKEETCTLLLDVARAPGLLGGDIIYAMRRVESYGTPKQKEDMCEILLTTWQETQYHPSHSSYGPWSFIEAYGTEMQKARWKTGDRSVSELVQAMFQNDLDFFAYDAAMRQMFPAPELTREERERRMDILEEFGDIGKQWKGCDIEWRRRQMPKKTPYNFWWDFGGPVKALFSFLDPVSICDLVHRLASQELCSWGKSIEAVVADAKGKAAPSGKSSAGEVPFKKS